ncbi:CARDB domain-containing protein [uncultured Lamprocystis sp.]|jgi:alpha-tubulin suppressor-like RCC1 family protein|uniref:RCC1 domain-containing protein n=1 Tax=uncultured Lamprocystis sp. TaxID=543132 RepID=UPI0025D22759|nr:CARDB domain-containing protein [uncultured Lamprocystis sp.]
MFFELFRRPPGPRAQRAALLFLCSILTLTPGLGQAAEPPNAAALRDQVAAAGWLTVRVDLRAPAQTARAATAADQDDLEQTAQDLLFALPAGSYDGVRRTAGSASLTLRVNAAGLDALLLSPLATVAAAGNPDMQRLATAYFHSLALKTDNSLWAWGYGGFCALGDGTCESRPTPVQVLTGVAAVEAGGYHSLALKTDSSLWAWGYNYAGQLGDGTTRTSPTPVQVLTEIATMAAGELHTLALKTDGSLWTWGSNEFGQLGDGTAYWSLRPLQVLTGIAAVEAGGYHSLAIKTDGSLWAWGYNYAGQLGDGTTTTQLAPIQVMTGVASVVAGVGHTLAIKTDGSLWAWGSNWGGQIGDGTTTDHRTPVQIMTGVAAVAAGYYHTLALKTDGSLWAWGNNWGGQIGDGTTTDRLTPIQVMAGVAAVSAGNAYTLARKTDGSLWAWGNNEYGKLGDGTTTDRPRPVQVAGFLGPNAPDFVVTAVTINPLDPLANSTFSATITLQNQGTVAATLGTLQVWANQTATQGCSAVGDQAATLGRVAAGAKRTVTVNGLPAGTAGAKTLRVFVDSQCQTAETNETYNQFTKAYTVFGRPTPDFVVTSIVLPSGSPSVGATFSAAITIKNQGSGAGNGGYLDVWTDQPAAQTCRADGDTFVSVGTLAAGASTTLTIDGLLGGTTGTKTLRAFVDSYCGTGETREGNNQKTAIYTVGP